ncbi:MAG: hypothetical protein QW197_01180 [Candidatus Aenigmatarchaeota archaeon]
MMKIKNKLILAVLVFLVLILIFLFLVFPIIISYFMGLPVDVKITDIIIENNISYIELMFNLSRIPQISFDIKIESNLENASIILETPVVNILHDLNAKDIYKIGDSIIIKDVKPSRKLSYLYVYGESKSSIFLNISFMKKISFLNFEVKYVVTK